MNNFRVLEHDIFFEGKTIKLVIEKSDGSQLNMCRVKWAHNSYNFTIEDEEGNDIDITDIVSEKIKSTFATIHHEQYILNNL